MEANQTYSGHNTVISRRHNLVLNAVDRVREYLHILFIADVVAIDRTTYIEQGCSCSSDECSDIDFQSSSR